MAPEASRGAVVHVAVVVKALLGVDCLLVADSCLINAMEENDKTANGEASRCCRRQTGREETREEQVGQSVGVSQRKRRGHYESEQKEKKKEEK